MESNLDYILEMKDNYLKSEKTWNEMYNNYLIEETENSTKGKDNSSTKKKVSLKG